MLSEYYVTVTCKLQPGLSDEDAWEDVTALFAWNPLPTDKALMSRAHAVQERFGFSWWDSLIVAAAHASGCEYLVSEELQDGQDLGGMVVVNPMVHTPDEVLSVTGP